MAVLAMLFIWGVEQECNQITSAAPGSSTWTLTALGFKVLSSDESR